MISEKIPFENKAHQEVPPSAPPSAESIKPHEIILEYLNQQTNIEQKDINAVEKIVLPQFKKLFDEADDQKKMEWAAIHKLPKDLLKKIVKLQQSGQSTHLPGIHNFGNNLNFLSVCTNDPKYEGLGQYFTQTQH